MELVDFASSAGSELASCLTDLAERGVWRGPQGGGPREGAAQFLVARLAAELRELEQLVVRSRECLVIEERGLTDMAAGIAREAQVAEAVRSAAEDLGRTVSAVAAHAAELNAVYERLPAVLAGTVATMEALESGTMALREGLQSGEQVSTRLAAGWLGVGDAIGEISGAARRAGVLGISAAIEAAYVSEGHGFAMVAQRMRTLSASMSEATSGVKAVVEAARRSAREAFDVIVRVGAFMERIVAQIAPARAALSGAQVRIDAFGDGVKRVTDAADEQNAALPQVIDGLARLSTIATAIATRAETDLHAEIGARLDEATAVLRRHRDFIALAPVAQPGLGEDPLADWIVALADDDAVPPPPPASEDVAVLDALVRLLERVVTDERTIVESMSSATRAAVSTGLLWRAIRKEMRAFDKEIAELATRLEESLALAAAFTAAAGTITSELDALHDVCASALVAFDEALDRVEAGNAEGERAVAAIAAVHDATNEAATLLAQVSDISDDAHLLALNAAVEAARTGTGGAGFTVVADEIGRLAVQTQASTDAIVATMTKLRARSAEFGNASHQHTVKLDGVRTSARSARDVVEDVRRTIGTSRARSAEIGETAAHVSSSLAAVARELAVACEQARSLSQRETENARIALGRIDDAALHVTRAHRLGLAEEALRDFTHDVALGVEAAIQRLADEGRVTTDALIALEYRELTGPLVDRFERLVGATGVPREGLRPPRYTTPSDHLVDETVLPVLNAAIERNPQLVIAALFDLNGYGIALSTVARDRAGKPVPFDWKTWGGKMIFTDLMTLRAGRLGLPDTDALPERMTSADVASAGLDLRAQHPRPWQYSTCANWANSEVCRGASWPVYVNGVRVAVVTCLEAIRTSRRDHLRAVES
jgi:methyl-accepting chemotaxis protein